MKVTHWCYVRINHRVIIFCLFGCKVMKAWTHASHATRQKEYNKDRKISIKKRNDIRHWMMTTESMEMNFTSQLRSRCKSTLNAMLIAGIYPPRLQMELLKLFLQLTTWVSKGCLFSCLLSAYMPGGAKQAELLLSTVTEVVLVLLYIS